MNEVLLKLFRTKRKWVDNHSTQIYDYILNLHNNKCSSNMFSPRTITANSSNLGEIWKRTGSTSSASRATDKRVVAAGLKHKPNDLALFRRREANETSLIIHSKLFGRIYQNLKALKRSIAMAKVHIQFILIIAACMQLANSMRLMPHEDTEETPRKKRNFVSFLLQFYWIL